jgi:hypothetical protein
VLVDDLAGFVDNQQSRDAPKLENVPFLAVEIGDGVFGVRQASEREAVFAPVAAVGIGAIGADGEDFRVTRGECRIIIAQAREMGAAMRSHKAAQEDENEVLFVFEIRETHWAARNVGESKVRSEGEGFHRKWEFERGKIGQGLRN